MSSIRSLSAGEFTENRFSLWNRSSRPPFLDRQPEIPICRGDDSHIDRDGFCSSQPLELHFLQNAQDLCLGLEVHVADFIEKDRSFVGEFELSDLAFGRARESALLEAKKLTFQ